MTRNFLMTIFTISLFSFFVSCSSSQKKDKTIDEENLFSLEYGNFEEQINLFSLRDVGDISTNIDMQDGFFYVVNGSSQKIMSLNSYGDLLSVYYNADVYSEKNPGLVENSTDGIWKAVEYPFDYTGKIAVDSRKYMSVVCTVPQDKHEQSEEGNLLYKHVILCFSSDGKPLYYLGQEGHAGTPFPYIKDIWTTENNELVVISVTSDGLLAFWFSKDGFLRYKVPIATKDVPHLSSDISNNLATNDFYLTVESAIPDLYDERLYIKVDYYTPHIDFESKVQSGVDFVSSFVYPLNIETALYGEAMNVPPYMESVTQDFSKITYKLPYNFLGVSKKGWFFFIITTTDGYNVQMMKPNSHDIIRRTLKIKHKDTLYCATTLSPEGIISGLLADKEKVNVVWWRTDELLEGMLKG